MNGITKILEAIEMNSECYLVAGSIDAWLCSSLNPICYIAKIGDLGIYELLNRKLPGRPGAVYTYMERCHINCIIEDGVVVSINSLKIFRDLVITDII